MLHFFSCMSVDMIGPDEFLQDKRIVSIEK